MMTDKEVADSVAIKQRAIAAEKDRDDLDSKRRCVEEQLAGCLKGYAKLRAEVERLKEALALAQGVTRADDHRLAAAGKRVRIFGGCDTPSDMADVIESLRHQVKQLREAAEIFRDFGRFDHISITHPHHKYDREQVTRANLILRPQDESTEP